MTIGTASAPHAPSRRLALIEHDNKKVDLIMWAAFNRETLVAFDLVATRHTAPMVREKVGLEVDALLSGPEGGDARNAARVATRAVATSPPPI